MDICQKVIGKWGGLELVPASRTDLENLHLTLTTSLSILEDKCQFLNNKTLELDQLKQRVDFNTSKIEELFHKQNGTEHLSHQTLVRMERLELQNQQEEIEIVLGTLDNKMKNVEVVLAALSPQMEGLDRELQQVGTGLSELAMQVTELKNSYLGHSHPPTGGGGEGAQPPSPSVQKAQNDLVMKQIMALNNKILELQRNPPSLLRDQGIHLQVQKNGTPLDCT